MRSKEIITLGNTLVILGIIFSQDQFISYLFISAGVLLSVISAFKLRKKPSAQSQRTGGV